MDEREGQHITELLHIPLAILTNDPKHEVIMLTLIDAISGEIRASMTG